MLPIRVPSTQHLGSLSGGGVSERPKERASKAREGQPSAGSNPAATASLTRPNAGPRRKLGACVFGCGLECGLNWSRSARLCWTTGGRRAAGQVTVDRHNYVRVAARHRGG
jgi:hypothetical protein